MDFNIEIRKKQLESLDQFVYSSRDKLQSLLDSLGWTVDRIEEERLMVTCPHNACHKIPAEKIEEHLKKCEIKSAGYSLDEKFLAEPGDFPPERRIKLDTIKKIEVLSQALTQTPFFQTAWNGQDPDPQTYSRLVTTFSRDERLALYNYAVSNTKAPPELPEFDTSIIKKEEGDLPYSKQALMSFERDIKRRSVKYKPIHTNHKNYREVLKEVIDSQMRQYGDWLSNINSSRGPHTPEYNHTEETFEEAGNDEKCDEYIDRPHSSVSRISNNSSSSQSTIKRRERSSKRSHDHSRNRSRERDRRRYKEDDIRSSKYSSSNKYRTNHYDDDSQESNNHSKVSTPLMNESIDSSNDHYDNTPKSASRDSSVHNSNRYKRKSERSRDRQKHKSRSPSSDRKMRKVHRKCRSRSRNRSTDRKLYKSGRISRERSRKREKHRDGS